MTLKEHHNFHFEPEDLIKSFCSTERYNLALSTELLHEPEDELLYVFTGCSKLIDKSNAAAGVCCDLFSYIPIGIHGTAFDAEIAAISIALSQPLEHWLLYVTQGQLSKQYLPSRHQ
ncbi:hypothetical protein TNCV_2192311 [Trichonephila clavipes]|nr:hypothetical protein TNCV_2192311 [Trichonephila clavipes]